MTSKSICAECIGEAAILLAEETKYRVLVEHIPAITYIAAMDETSSTLYTSPQIEPILGFSQAEWMADNTMWFKQIHAEDREFVLCELARIRIGGDPVPCEYRMFTRDRRTVWFRDDAAVLRDRNGQPQLLYGVMLDVTERKSLEIELVQTQRRLIESVRKLFNKRELAILQLLQAGWTDRQIGQKLSVCERTVSYSLRSLYSKLGVTKRVEAVREAARLRLLDE